MASPRSSADEGEIVERQGAGHHLKAKTSATVAAAAAPADDDVDSFNVDRRNRNPRGRPSRSPDRGADATSRSQHDQRGSASLSSYPYRNASPRGLKRQRDDRDAAGGGSRWAGSGDRNGLRGGRGDRYDYDNGPRDNSRRDGPRDGPRPSNDGRRWDRDRDRDRELRYDDDDSRDRPSSSSGRRNRGDQRYDNNGADSAYSRNAIGKRQRTRSRSPPPSSFRGNGNRGRNERDRRDRDRDFDRNRDRDYYRDDRDRGGRFDRRANRDHAEPNGQKQGSQLKDTATNGTADSARRGSRGEASEQAPPRAPPLPQEDWVEQAPIDEEAEIKRRRQRREEILRKSRASTPLLALSLQAGKTAASMPADSKTQENTPVAGNDTPRSFDAVATASPAGQSTGSHDQDDTEVMNLADDQDFMKLLGKQNAGNSSVADNGATNGTEDGPSAADYDPTVDMEEDERRDELRHGGTVAGLHGAERRESLVAQAEDKDREHINNGPPAPVSNGPEEAKAKKDDHDDDDDGDDMFAEDFVEKKYEAPKNNAAPAAVASKDGAAAAGVLPVAAANGGGILEGDDMQGYYKIRRGEILDGRYQIQSALGKGMFSGVARAWDITSPDKREVAIKIMRNNDALRKGGYTEIAILQKLNEADPDNKKHIVRFERPFDFRGHLCMSFENLSMNLREVLKKFGNNVGINLHGVRVYAYQIFVALAHMRRCSIIHADLKPDNILVNDNRSTLKICDLGTAIDRSDAATAHMEITPYLVSRFYRAPEIILGMPYDYAVDMWSIGCTLYELYTGKILFTGESNNQMLRAIMEIRGKISGKLYRRGELWRMHFDDMGGFLSQEHDKFQGKTTIKTLPMVKPTRDLRTRLMAASAGMDDAETRDLNLFHDLLDRCLSLNPDKRILPSDALKHPFFTSRSGR